MKEVLTYILLIVSIILAFAATIFTIVVIASDVKAAKERKERRKRFNKITFSDRIYISKFYDDWKANHDEVLDCNLTFLGWLQSNDLLSVEGVNKIMECIRNVP